MISISNVTKVYRMGPSVIKALDCLSLEIADGEFVSLVGPSGSGKSTLMNVIGALDNVDKGSIIVGKDDISKFNDLQQAKYRRDKIGFVFQTFNLQRRLNALENVELPLIFSGVPKKERRKISLEALKKVGLSERVMHKPTELSGGEQQRVSIARAIVNNPKILLADEPTGNLDSKTGQKIMELIRDLDKKEDVTVIMVTHNEEHAKFADRVLYMLDGRIHKEKEGGNEN